MARLEFEIETVSNALMAEAGFEKGLTCGPSTTSRRSRRFSTRPSPTSLAKVARRLTPLYRRWIEAARFCVLSTVGPEGTDGSPRGDDGPVVRVVDDRTLWLPDWRGNNRIDSLRNIVRDGRVSLMFMVPGSNNVVRVNGRAVLTDDPDVTGLRTGRAPPEARDRRDGGRGLLPVRQGPHALAPVVGRAGGGRARPRAQFLREADAGFDAETYDADLPRAREGADVVPALRPPAPSSPSRGTSAAGP
jgi:uncharacterized protein